MYRIHFQSNSLPVTPVLDHWVRHLAQYLASRHPELLDLEIHLGCSRPRRGGTSFRVRIDAHTRGARHTVIGQSLVHVRAALRSAFDAAHAVLNRRARRRLRASRIARPPAVA